MQNIVLSTVVGTGLVFFGGVAYVKWYKWNVLNKMELAFQAGYDPVLELAIHPLRGETPASAGKTDEIIHEMNVAHEPVWTRHLRRKEQDRVDRIIHGEEAGHYYILMGPKGSGKTSMIFDAMRTIQADGVAMCDAHPDLEVFRLHLGIALNYEFNEDTQTWLFQRRDPREGGPALDIERAMCKLEKVALRSSSKRGKPLVLVINNAHFFHNNEAGLNMLLQLQQRAESWAASGILTMVFTTDDFWPYSLMRKHANRMHVVSIYDLDAKEAVHASVLMRTKAGKWANDEKADDVLETVRLLGGRLAYLSKAAKAKNMVKMAQHLLDTEKASLLSQIGLILDCDSDVVNEQKWSYYSWLLLQEFVKMRKGQERMWEEAKAREESTWESKEDIPLPKIPYWMCRQIMTRADFLEKLDRMNIITIDVTLDVRPESMLIVHAAREVMEQEGFEEKLNSVRDRISEIEGLQRTRELTFKDVVKETSFGWSWIKGLFR